MFGQWKLGLSPPPPPYLNFEVKMSTVDPRTAEELEQVFHKFLGDSKEVTLESWEQRGLIKKFTHWLAYRICSLTQFF